MANHTLQHQLPDYQELLESTAILELPISISELHGVMCGYLAAGASRDGENYVRALLTHRTDLDTRSVAMALFNLYTISQQQIAHLGFEFQLLLPDEQTSLFVRAQAFSEWCEGFTQGVTMAGINYEHLKDEDAQEAIQHMTEFAHLDYQTLQVGEEDERALMEVCEYARMAVLHIHSDLLSNKFEKGDSDIAH